MKEKVWRVRHSVDYSSHRTMVSIGTAVEVVRNMFRNRSPFLGVQTPGGYLSYMTKAMSLEAGRKLKLSGKNHEKRCADFLRKASRYGWVKNLSANKNMCRS